MKRIEKIRKIIKNVVSELVDKEIPDDMDMIASGYLDSYEVICLISELESAFSIQIPLEELNFEDFETVASIDHMIGGLSGQETIA